MSIRVCIDGREFLLSRKEFEKALVSVSKLKKRMTVLAVNPLGGVYVAA